MEMGEFVNWNVLWPWPRIRSHSIPLCIIHQPLHTNQISFKSEKLSVNG